MEIFSALLVLCERNPPADSPHKGQWRRILMFSLICVWMNGWINNRGAGDLRRYRAHCDVTVMSGRLDSSNTRWHWNAILSPCLGIKAQIIYSRYGDLSRPIAKLYSLNLKRPVSRKVGAYFIIDSNPWCRHYPKLFLKFIKAPSVRWWPILESVPW